MKLAFKAIVAALTLTVAGGAFAQTATTSSTGTDLYFYAYDNSTASSFIIDLGSNYSNFNGSSSLSPIDIAANSYYQSFASGVTDGATVWGVFAAASIGSGATLQTGLDVTTGSSTLSGTKGKFISNQVANVNTLMSGISSQISQSAITGGAFTSGAVAQNPQSAIANFGYGTNSGLVGVSVANPVGTAANFINYSATGPVGNALITPTAYAGTWTFDGTNLDYTVGSVAAVPEPSSYLMMLAGLLMFGAIAMRRRDSK